MAVRREKVVLELEDRFSTGMVKAAAATALLDKNLKDLDGSTTRADRDLDKFGSQSGGLSKSNTQLVKASNEIDRFSGRMRLLTDVAAILGPGLVPIGAVGIPAVAGLAAQFSAAALAGGTALVAFQDVGTALEAVNKAALEPTAENLEAARIAMGNLGPEARGFVRELRAVLPVFEEVHNAAAAGLMPGLSESLEEMARLAPEVERIVFNIGNALGDLAADSADSLAGPRWAEFLSFLASDVPGTLSQLGRSIGNVTHGLAELWMAFDPLNDGFSQWMLNASRGFDDWAAGLAKTEGFQEFVDYVRANGPKLADALASVGNAVLQIVEAAAPLGGPVLDALAAVADVVASIAGSDAGPAIMSTVTALALLNRGMKTFESISSTSWGNALKGADGYAAKVSTIRSTALRGAGALAGLGVAASGAADDIGLTNTVSGALLGSLGGPWGAAVGGAVGLMLDFAGSHEDTSAAVEEVTATLDQQTGAITANTREWAAKKLLDSGALDQASRLGLDLEKVTDAALGQGDAVKYVNEETSRLLAQSFEGEFFDPQMNKDATALRKNLVGVAGAVADGKSNFGLMKQATGQVAGGFRQAASAAEQFKAAVDRAFALLDKRAALRAAREAVRSFADVMKDLPKHMHKGTANFDKAQAALDEIARSALTAADHLKGMDRQAYLKGARRDFIDAAEKMGIAKGRARELAQQLGLLNNVHSMPKITVQSNAGDIAAQTAAILRNIPDEIVQIHAVRSGPGGQGGGFGSGGLASGGTVAGQRFPYGDKVLTYLAPGEEVISNRYGQADRNRELLQAINSNRYADGGTVELRQQLARSRDLERAQFASMSMGRSGGRTVVIQQTSGPLEVKGTLNTPWGPAQVEGIARASARSELESDRRYQSRLDDRE